MARTPRTQPPPSLASNPRPRDESRQSASSGGDVPPGRRAAVVSSGRADGSASTSNPDESPSSRRSSPASASRRAGQPAQSRAYSQERQPYSSHHASVRNERYSYSRHDTRYDHDRYNRNQPYRDEYDHRDYRGKGRGEDPQRSHNDRSYRSNDRHQDSGWGRNRESDGGRHENFRSHQHQGYSSHHDGHAYSGQRNYGHRRGDFRRDNDYHSTQEDYRPSSSNRDFPHQRRPDNASASGQFMQQPHHQPETESRARGSGGVHHHEQDYERRPEYEQSSARRDPQPHQQSNQSQASHCMPPSQNELEGENERLKAEIERMKLKRELEQQKTKLLEQEQINKKLSQMQSKNPQANDQDLQDSCSEDEKMPASIDLADSDNDEPKTAKKKSTKTKKKSIKRTSKATGAAKKKKTKHRASEATQLTKSTKRKLKEAQKANDEKMKFEMLKAYEEELAARKKTKTHCYTEKDLMSSYTPVIIDHHLMDVGYGKFLTKWIPRKGKGTDRERENPCVSWVRHEDFLFPAMAFKYLKSKIKSKSSESESLKLWMESCEEQERCLNCLNTFGANDEEFESNMEIDFCCFLCKCPWDHPMKRMIRNCTGGLKYHRACCHGYKNNDDLESFESPVGRTQRELLEQFEKEADADDVNEVAETEDNTTEVNVAVIHQVLNSDEVIGDCQPYYQCRQNRSSLPTRKRDAVVLSINSGVGAATVSLKNLGIGIKKIIHIESDPVARHVIHSMHDYSFGEVDINDGVEHVVGLYETLAEVCQNIKALVINHGPIDMVVCSCPEDDSVNNAYHVETVGKFFALVTEIEKWNKEHNHSDSIFYLLQCPPNIKQFLHLEGRSYTCDGTGKLYVWNWPPTAQDDSSPRPSETPDILGLPKDYALQPVSTLYTELREALCVGFDGCSKWSEKLHPKFFSFLNIGPTGYDVKLKKGMFGPDAFLLRLQCRSELLSDVGYTNHLLRQLLKPMQKLFNKKDYGPAYKVVIPEQEQPEELQDRAATDEHDGASPPNSNDKVQVPKAEPKEEEMESTDDEINLFDQVEASLRAE